MSESGSMVVCPGCFKLFERDGHATHLARTRKASCRDLRFRIPALSQPSMAHEMLPGMYTSQMQSASVNVSAAMPPAIPIPFTGDFYGIDYTAADLGQPEDNDEPMGGDDNGTSRVIHNVISILINFKFPLLAQALPVLLSVMKLRVTRKRT